MGLAAVVRALITWLFYDIPLEVDQTAIRDVEGHSEPFPLILIADSYSVGDRCYCENLIGFEGSETLLDTKFGKLTAAEICDLLGPGPGSIGRPFYNDLQCGNGPFIGLTDEETCPGRVDQGRKGCGVIGPTWNWEGVDGPN